MLVNLRLPSISLFVIAMHAVLILWMAWVVPKPLLQTSKPRVVVHTVALSPKQKVKPTSKVVQESIAETIEEPVSEPESLAIEAMPRLEQTSVKAVEVEPIPVPKKKTVRTEAPKKAAKTPSKPKETPKQTQKQIPKQTQKQIPKQTQKQAQKTKEKSKNEQKQPTSTKTSKKNQELLSKAQESIAKIRPAGVKIDANPKGKAAELQIPQLTLAIIADEENGLWSEGELSYRDELAGRLKLQLILPEYGSVKLKLTLTKTGGVVKVVILSAASPKNRAYVEKQMPSLQFPPFGNHFSQEPEHTFTITLNNDL